MAVRHLHLLKQASSSDAFSDESEDGSYIDSYRKEKDTR